MPLSSKELQNKALAILDNPNYRIPPDITSYEKASIEARVKEIQKMRAMFPQRGGKSKKNKQKQRQKTRKFK
jgi:hypothetical protein